MVTYDINMFFFKHFHQAVSCVCGVIKQHVAWLYPDCTVIAGHMQTNTPLPWCLGKGELFLCSSKQHICDCSFLEAELYPGLTRSQDEGCYSRHCLLRFCLHSWPLLLNHKHLLTLSDKVMLMLHLSEC